MCGRAAQSSSSVKYAMNEFGVNCVAASSGGGGGDRDKSMTSTTTSTTTTSSSSRTEGPMPDPATSSSSSSSLKSQQQGDHYGMDGGMEWTDNFNLSPGMDASVIFLDRDGDFRSHGDSSSSSSSSVPNLCVRPMKWGLITKQGTPSKPLYDNDGDIIKLCFERLCYNARSDTLFEKPTFARLANASMKRSCIVAFDGYFEWKTTIAKLGKKQPYFVYNNNKNNDDNDNNNNNNNAPQSRQPLLLPGLWTKTSTGRTDVPILYSFTILTTETTHTDISWLHHRMPICIWDHDLALRWLQNPSSPKLLSELDNTAKRMTTSSPSGGGGSSSNNNKNIDDMTTANGGGGFGWHKVTPDMTSLKYRSSNAICEYKDPTQSVKAFFTVGGAGTAATTNKNNKTPTKPSSQSASAVGSGVKLLGKEQPSSSSKPEKRSFPSISDLTTSSQSQAKKLKIERFISSTATTSTPSKQRQNPMTTTTTTKTSLNNSNKKKNPSSSSKGKDTSTPSKKQRSITSFFGTTTKK